MNFDVDHKAVFGQRDGTNVSRLRSDAAQKNSSTGIRGVSQLKDGRFEAYVYFRRHKTRVGIFGTLEEAARARKKAAERIHGEYLESIQEKSPPA